MRIVIDKYYVPPDREEIKKMNKLYGAKIKNIDMVQDVASYYVNGDLVPPEELARTVRSILEKYPIESKKSTKEKPLYVVPSKKTITENKKDAIEDQIEFNLNRLNYTRELITQSLEIMDSFRGSPLNKAIQYILFLEDLHPKKEEDKESEDSGCIGDTGFDPGEGSPITAASNILKNVLEEVSKFISRDTFGDEALSDGTRNNTSYEGTCVAYINRKYDKSLNVTLNVAEILDEFIPSVSGKRLIPDPSGNIIKHRKMTGIEEISAIEDDDWVDRKINPLYFIKNCIDKQYNVEELFSYENKKQFVYILADGSGSMGSGDRIAKCAGVVFNRFSAVNKGLAKVWVSSFDSNLSKNIIKASSPKEAGPQFQEFRKTAYNGGGTDIGRSLMEAISRMEEEIKKEGGSLKLPEVIIITDDDSSSSNVDFKKIEGLQIKVHGVCVLDQDNTNLKDLCEKTGGQYVTLSSKNIAKAQSKEKEKKGSEK